MGRLLFVLVIALVGCSLSLVSSQYKGRSLFVELERSQGAARDLDVDWRRLQLEQTDHAKHALIDKVARSTLKMDAVTPARTIYLTQRRGAPDTLSVMPYGEQGTPPPGRKPAPARGAR